MVAGTLDQWATLRFSRHTPTHVKSVQKGNPHGPKYFQKQRSNMKKPHGICSMDQQQQSIRPNSSGVASALKPHHHEIIHQAYSLDWFYSRRASLGPKSKRCQQYFLRWTLLRR